MGQDKTQHLIHNWSALFHSLNHETTKRKIITIKQNQKEVICLQNTWVDLQCRVNICSTLAPVSKVSIMRVLTSTQTTLPYSLLQITVKRMCLKHDMIGTWKKRPNTDMLEIVQICAVGVAVDFIYDDLRCLQRCESAMFEQVPISRQSDLAEPK